MAQQLSDHNSVMIEKAEDEVRELVAAEVRKAQMDLMKRVTEFMTGTYRTQHSRILTDFDGRTCRNGCGLWRLGKSQYPTISEFGCNGLGDVDQSLA